MTSKASRGMSLTQRRRIARLLAKSIPDLSFEEAQAAIDARGTLQQGAYAAFEPFLGDLGSGTGRDPSPVIKDYYDIQVPYRGRSTIRALIKAGNYDWQNGDVSDVHFPQVQKGERQIRIKLVHFKRVISSQDVLLRLEARGLRSANPAELLALGAMHPHLQRAFPIIALGQSWLLANGDRLIVCLAWHSMLRRIHLLCQFRRDWPEHCRFAAVSINPPKSKKIVLPAPRHK